MRRGLGKQRNPTLFIGGMNLCPQWYGGAQNAESGCEEQLIAPEREPVAKAEKSDAGLVDANLCNDEESLCKSNADEARTFPKGSFHAKRPVGSVLTRLGKAEKKYGSPRIDSWEDVTNLLPE